MLQALTAKFSQNHELRALLLATGGASLWHKAGRQAGPPVRQLILEEVRATLADAHADAFVDALADALAGALAGPPPDNLAGRSPTVYFVAFMAPGRGWVALRVSRLLAEEVARDASMHTFCSTNSYASAPADMWAEGRLVTVGGNTVEKLGPLERAAAGGLCPPQLQPHGELGAKSRGAIVPVILAYSKRGVVEFSQ
jgi:hypothetical protein